MSTQIVDEFIIELGINDRLTKAFEQIEKKLTTACNRMEARLTKTLGKDFTLQTRRSLDRLVSQSQTASKQINKAFRTIGGNGIDSVAFFRDFREQATAAARDVQRTLNRIHSRVTVDGSPPPATPTPRPRRRPRVTTDTDTPPPTTRPRRTASEVITARFQNSAAYQRLQNAGGESTIRARELQSRFNAALSRTDGTLEQMNTVLHRFRDELHRSTRAASEDATARLRSARQERTPQRRNAGGSSRGGLTGAFVKGNMIVQSIEAFVHYAEEAVKRGYEGAKEKAQSKTMLETAVGEQNAPQMQEQISGYANRYGLDRTDTTKEFSKLRSVFGKDKISNSQLLDMMEQESVAGHSMGISNDQIKGANTQISQIAAGSKVMKSDLNALGNNVAEWARVIGKGLGKSADWVKQNYQAIKPDDFLKAWRKGLTELNTESGAAIKAQVSLQAAEGRFSQAFGDDMTALFESSGNGFANLLDLLSRGMEAAVPYFEYLGKSISTTVDIITSMVDWLGSWQQNLTKLKESLPPGFVTLLDDLGTALHKLGAESFYEMGLAVDAAKIKIDSFWQWLKSFGSDSDEGTSEKYGSNVTKRGERFFDWVDEKLTSFNISDEKYAALKDNYAGLTQSQANGILQQGMYKPHLPPAPTGKLEIPDKTFTFELKDSDGKTISTVSTSTSDLFHFQEGQNHMETNLNTDYSMSY
jgi:hypothetical protein